MEWLNGLATVAIALSAIASFLLNWRLRKENRILRKTESRPEVVAYVTLDGRYGSIVNLVLENIGRGPACEVEYFVDADPADFARCEVLHVPAQQTRKIASLLLQGERKEWYLGFGHKLYSEVKELRLQPFNVIVSYSNLEGGSIESKEWIIDIAELAGLSVAQAGKSPEMRIADSMETIAKSIKSIAQ